MSNRLISDKKVNCSRQFELDLLKAYPILFMIIIHVYENLSVGRIDPTPRTCLEHVLQFLAGPATAPAYMFAIVVLLSVSHPISVRLRGSALMDCVRQISIHLNKIFVIQWILIGIWFSICRTFDLPDIPLGWVIPVGILITMVTLLIIWHSRRAAERTE